MTDEQREYRAVLTCVDSSVPGCSYCRDENDNRAMKIMTLDKVFGTKQEAIDYGKSMARKVYGYHKVSTASRPIGEWTHDND